MPALPLFLKKIQQFVLCCCHAVFVCLSVPPPHPTSPISFSELAGSISRWNLLQTIIFPALDNSKVGTHSSWGNTDTHIYIYVYQLRVWYAILQQALKKWNFCCGRIFVVFLYIVKYQCVGHMKVFFGFQFLINKSLATWEGQVFFVPCFKLELYMERSWNGAVHMSRLLAGWSGFKSQEEADIFLLFGMSRWPWGLPSLMLSRYLSSDFFSRYEVNHLPLSKAEVRNEWSYPSSLCVCLHGMDRDCFIFLAFYFTYRIALT